MSRLPNVPRRVAQWQVASCSNAGLLLYHQKVIHSLHDGAEVPNSDQQILLLVNKVLTSLIVPKGLTLNQKVHISVLSKLSWSPEWHPIKLPMAMSCKIIDDPCNAPAFA